MTAAIAQGPARSGTIPCAAAFAKRDEGDARPLPPMSDGRPRPPRLQGTEGDEESRASRPKLGRQGRREIGRALEAMYEDVVKQGVPPRILKLLEGLDDHAGSNPDAPSA